MSLQWTSHTSAELKQKISEGWTTAILPVGSIEQHGTHLCVDYDIRIAERLAQDLALNLGGCFILPGLSYGAAEHHLGFTGTLSITKTTLLGLFSDIAKSLEVSGVDRLIVTNGHGGNYEAIAEFAASHCGPLRILHDGDRKILFKVIQDLTATFSAGALGMHGGLFETSLALFTHEAQVRLDAAQRGSMPADPVLGWTAAEISALLRDGLRKTVPTGIIGDPVGSTPDLGRDFYNRVLNEYIALCSRS